MTKLNKKKIREAIPGSMGIYVVIAGKCGVDRSTITKFLQKEKNQDIVKEIQEEGEKMIDIGERKLAELILAGNFNAIKLLLTTKGRGRGYVEKQEIESNVKINMEMENLRKAIRDGVPFQ